MNGLDEEFLKNVVILYVEDEVGARQEISELFEGIFKEVLTAPDGKEALQLYEKSVANNKCIDIIVSDINMPKMNGIELLESIRKHSAELPFIFTTAYSDSPNLLNAIKYKVTSYVLKPIDIPTLILEIQEYTKKLHENRKFQNEKEELSRYLESIDKVAIVLKSDKEHNLTYANKAFYEITKFAHEDVIGKKYDDICHSDVSSDILKQMWDEANKGNFWKGKLKSKTKDNMAFYVNTTTFPIYDEDNKNIVEFYHISFSITEDELEKRDFKKQVITNVQDSRRQNDVARKMIDELKSQLNKYKHMDLVYETLAKEQKKSKEYLSQLKYYARKIEGMEED